MTALAIVAAAAVFAPAAKAADVCDPGKLTVLTLDNQAVLEIDKYWGNPRDFEKATTFILAARLLADSGKYVRVVNAPGISLFNSDKRINIEAVGKAAGEDAGCFVAVGAVTEAIVDTSRSAKLPMIKKKFKIRAAARLALVDLREEKELFNDLFVGSHETSDLPTEFLDAHKQQDLPIDPVQAGGSGMGIPFSRMFTQYSKKALEIIK